MARTLKAVAPSSADMAEAMRELVDNLYKDLLDVGFTPNELGGNVPASWVLYRIMFNTNEPLKTYLLNSLRNNTFVIATSRPLAVRWERDAYQCGPVAASFSMPVATQILLQVNVLNTTYRTQYSQHLVHQATKVDNPAVMFSWKSFTKQDEKQIIMAPEKGGCPDYLKLFKLFTYDHNIVARPLVNKADLFVPTALKKAADVPVMPLETQPTQVAQINDTMQEVNAKVKAQVQPQPPVPVPNGDDAEMYG